MLDAAARRYGRRPSELARGDAGDFQLDLLAYSAAWIEEERQRAEAGEEAPGTTRREEHLYW